MRDLDLGVGQLWVCCWQLGGDWLAVRHDVCRWWRRCGGGLDVEDAGKIGPDHSGLVVKTRGGGRKLPKTGGCRGPDCGGGGLILRLLDPC